MTSTTQSTAAKPRPSSLQSLVRQRATDTHSERPHFFRLTIADDAVAMQQLLSANSDIRICDSIRIQLKDLVKLEHPSLSLSEADYDAAIELKLNGFSEAEYGVWVYYPWRRELVHMLDESEFIRVRTIRNAHNVTFEEQAQLRSKKVGIVGLSVGQSVSLCVAMERSAGEIRIADFDTLELSNLNRIRTGVRNLGVRKTTVVAREIAEIDPFIKVVCFHQGLNEQNVDAFFDEGGPIDLLIEECDSVDIKILARMKARTRGIPVLMDTSDRGMIDIERFDQDSAYPILHGLIDASITPEFIRSLKSSAEKIPYVMPILGADTISGRLKASLAELGKSITTWPQLGGDVALGGALCANVGRRILLGEPIGSGRSYVDINELIPAQVNQS